MTIGRIDVYFVCGGPYHDMDYPRIEILRLLNEHERIRVRIAENYHDIDAITSSDILVTFTVDTIPTLEEQQRISEWLKAGHRWLALHGTNSILVMEDNLIKTPRSAPLFMDMLGSQFISHPPIEPYMVHVTEPDHPLVKGLPSEFEIIDELYICEFYGENKVLLHSHFNGMGAEGFEETDFRNDDPRPVMWLRDYGKGEVLYLAPGHRRGRYDLRPFTDNYPKIEPGAWIQPSFYELLRRSIKWSMGEL